MSDTTASAAATGDAATGDQNTAPAGDGTTAPAGGEVDWKAEAEKWKALSRKNEADKKANADAAKKLAEIEAANLSETEKLAKRVEAAEKRAAELELKALKAEVGEAKKIPAHLLNGTTREELEAHADELIRFRGPEGTNDFGAGKPGTKSIDAGKGAQLTREQLKGMSPAEITEAKKAGRLNTLLGRS